MGICQPIPVTPAEDSAQISTAAKRLRVGGGVQNLADEGGRSLGLSKVMSYLQSVRLSTYPAQGATELVAFPR